ncbi:extracellular solute-binding protein, partial [Streptomyces fradiae]|uniref:extracellular solute-binding protein n=1 Tax=Streptomyces fradiae TaxID=1906 RepID=UPI0011815E45
MLEEVERWLGRRSWSVADRPIDRLLAAKRAHGTTVSVVLPALNEEATVGDIVAVIRRDLMSEAVPLVDELVVLDSGSTDRTAEVAAKAGARVVARDEVLPRIPAVPGKGEVLWRSLLVTDGDVVCFVDSDLREFDADFVTGIVGPLLTEPDVQFVKAMYDRPFTGAGAGAAGGADRGGAGTGPGGAAGAEGSGKGTITFWDNNGGVRTAVWQEIIKDFEAANPGIEVRYVPIPSEDVQSKYDTAIAGGGLPDVGGVGAAYLANMVAQNALDPVGKRIEESSLKGKLVPGMVESVKSAGGRGDEMYSVPTSASNGVLYYRTDLFKAA